MKSSSPDAWTVWTEIPVSDFTRARNFYEAVFDISMHVDDFGALKMGIFPHGTHGCAICYHEQFYQPGEQGPVVYFDGGQDLAQYLDRVEPAGGTIIIPKREIGNNRGCMALFKDTEGNRIGLRSKA
jgi:predicted enzyme related to lactoylglutathione lyase